MSSSDEPIDAPTSSSGKGRGPGDLERDLHDLYADTTGRFDRLAAAAGLRSDADFRNRDLRALSFVGADLRGYDFSGSDLTGTGLRHADRIGPSTHFSGAELDEEDADWIRRHRTPNPVDKTTFVQRFRKSLRSGDVFLTYQPKIELKFGNVIGLEVLARWRHSERGIVGPAEFIIAVEEFGLAQEFTLWTIEHAIQAQIQLSSSGHDLPVSVNLSPDLLPDLSFIDACVKALRGTNGRIGFEFPETAVIQDPDLAIGGLNRLAEAGARLVIDDYGTGLSSLAFLRQIPARELKIDPMFIRNLTSSSRDPLIVRSTIDLAHALEMEVTAEGVETEAALALLTVMGCDAAQGFLISRPTELVNLASLLDEFVDTRNRFISPIGEGQSGRHPSY